MRNPPKKHLACALLACALLSCKELPQASLASVCPLPAPNDPTAIQLPLVTTERAPGGLKGLVVDVSVGLGGETTLLLDTGSTGLRVFADAVKDGELRRTGVAVRDEFADGTIFEGEEAEALVRVGPLVTPVPVKLQVVDRVGCDPRRPHCPGAPGPSFMQQMGIQGIMGVSTRGKPESPGIFSVLSQLPPPFNAGFTIHAEPELDACGTLTLGVTSDDARFVSLQLERDEVMPTLANGAPAWQDAGPMACVSVDGRTGTNACAPTVFDTGTTDLFLAANAVGDDVLDDTRQVGSGRVVQLEQTSLPEVRWQFTVGAPTQPSQDRIYLQGDGRRHNTGIPFFFRYDVRFDLQRGRLGFRART